MSAEKKERKEKSEKNERVESVQWKRIVKIFRVFAPFLRPYTGKIMLAYVAMFAATGLSVLQPWPLKFIFDQALLGKPMPDKFAAITNYFGSEPLALLLVFSGAIVVLALFHAMAGYIHQFILSAVGQMVVNDIRESVFVHLNRVSMATRNQHTSGDLVLRMTSDIKKFRGLFIKSGENFATTVLMGVGVLTVMLWMDLRLGLLVLIVVPVQYLLTRYFSRHVQAATKTKRTKEGAVASIVNETVGSMALVQAFAQEKNENRRFVKEARESLAAGILKSRLRSGFKRLLTVTDSAGMAVVVGYGGMRVLEGDLTPGALIVFMAYVKQLYGPFEKLSEVIADFFDSVVSGERILELVETGTDIKDEPDAIKAPRFAGEVVFENVTFGYSRDEPPVLNDLSFTVKPGQLVALVGSSGTGKSTIVNLLLRFYDPWEGQILIDGVDIRKYKLRSLRRRMSTVLQDSFLFRRSIRENIAYAKPEATDEEIIAAATHAQAHDFIAKLPDGYNTILDERGDSLSGGQRRRIAVARAILRKTPILILDEPATGLDAVTEAKIHEVLDTLMRGTTTFIIAHKLSTIRQADLILVMEEGKIVEQGSHAELVSKSRIYRHFHDLQTDHERVGGQQRQIAHDTRPEEPLAEDRKEVGT